MSDDDDCDVFSVLSRRVPVQEVPKEQLSLPNDSLSQEADYDIINAADTQTTSKKRGKAAKPVTKSKKTTKSVNAKLPKDAKEVAAPRPLSPVSQLIVEMEENHTKEQANEHESAPVARRTRSSLSKADTKSKTTETTRVPNVSPPKQRRRGRKPLNANANEKVDLQIPQQSSHRRHVAELAARSKVVDSIDLVSAVMPRIEGFINLDSDEDTPKTAVESNVAQIDPDMDNYSINISLSWLGEIQVYQMRKFQKFTHMFQEVAKRNGVGVDDVVINMEDHFLKPHESPYGIGLKDFHILSGRAIKSNINNNNNINKLIADANSIMALTRKPKKFQLKVQEDRMKHPLIIPMKKTDTFNILYIQCSEELNCNVRDIQLFFDGDLLDPKDTPVNQDMEGNEMIDMRRKT